MKRKLLAILTNVVLLCAMIPLGVVAESVQSNTICEHKYEYDCSTHCLICGKETRPHAECVEKYYYSMCSDNECKYCGRYMEGPECVFVYTPALSPTCTELGNYECSRCINCGSGDPFILIPELGHTYDDDNDASCNRCGMIREVTTGLLYEIVDGEVTITGYTDDLPTDLVIPDTIEGYPVTTIGPEAFYGSSLISVNIPNSVTYIDGYAFYWCTDLTTITLSDSITNIKYDTFYGCSSLTSVIIPDGVIWIEVGAFNSCSSLTSIILPDSVTGIDAAAFADCTSLTSITIPDSVRTIGDLAFYNCSALTKIDLPDSVTTIEEWAFAACSSLQSIVIPDSVTTIDMCMFLNCTSLRLVTIPDSVTIIGEWAFDGCQSLTDIYYDGTETERSNIAIGTDNAPLLNAIWHYNYTPGDANGDGAVNARDLAILQQYVTDWDVTIDEVAADVNASGSVNARDVAMLQQYIAGWNVQLGK